MDDGDIETSNRDLFPNPNPSSTFQGSTSVDTFSDEFLKKTRTCTHTHTCNPPGPDTAHTHTCYHTHTQVLASEDDDGTEDQEHSIPRQRRRRPSGNREAVRKYREKKKAHTAYLEEEVKKLLVLNQQLVRKLQGRAILEAKILRLRSLLLDLGRKIDNELGAFPFQKQCNTTTIFKKGDCDPQATAAASGLRCQTDLPCFCPPVGSSLQASISASGRTMALFEGNCQPAVIDCRANTNEMASAEVQNSTQSTNLGIIRDTS